MYVPEMFAERRIDALHALVRAHPLGALVRTGADALEADHVPFELVVTGEAPQGVLRAHVARSNPLARQDGAPVLVLFQGVSAYVSPRLYDLAVHEGRVVPTWNYAVVHAHGRLRVVDDPEWIVGHMRRATALNEAKAGLPGRAWTLDDTPPGYAERLVGAVVGIEIAIERLDAKFKLSQNRSPAERSRVHAATGSATSHGTSRTD